MFALQRKDTKARQRFREEHESSVWVEMTSDTTRNRIYLLKAALVSQLSFTRDDRHKQSTHDLRIAVPHANNVSLLRILYPLLLPL